MEFPLQCVYYIYIHYHIISYVSYTSKIQIASSFLDWEEVWTLTTPGHRKIAGGVSYAGKFGIFEFIQGHRKHLFAHSFFNAITPGSRAFFSREQPFSFQSSCRKFFRAWVWDDRAVSVVLLGKLLTQKSQSAAVDLWICFQHGFLSSLQILATFFFCPQKKKHRA